MNGYEPFSLRCKGNLKSTEAPEATQDAAPKAEKKKKKLQVEPEQAQAGDFYLCL